GDVWDEHDEVKNDFIEQADGSYIVDCSAELDDFFEKFGVEIHDFEDLPQTVNGFIMKELETFPQVGDGFDFMNIHIQIEKISQKRVEKIKVTYLINQEESEKAAD
ncbi:MAG: hypothetical protein II980_03400, partial [Clostridia bacterium]|nr:hypothetical protein [Clostridia bacterium]